MRKLTHDQVIQRFHNEHGNRYGYGDVKYINQHTKVDIKCYEHGIFSQTPNNHIDGKGCSTCGGSTRLTHDQLIETFRNTHGDRYGYDDVIYVNMKTKIKIKCHIHGIFEQIADHHQNGCGCPTCGKQDAIQYNTVEKRLASLDVYVYHIRLSGYGEVFDKIGITDQPNNRFQRISQQSGYEIIGARMSLYDNREIATNNELRLHDKWQFDNGIVYVPNRKFDGMSECMETFGHPFGADLNNFPTESNRSKVAKKALRDSSGLQNHS